MNLFNLKPALILITASGLAFSSCKKEDPVTPPSDNNPTGYAIPSTYVFTNADGQNTVDYTGQMQRLNMLSEMVTYMKLANTPGTSIEAQTIKNMFANENHTWSDEANLGLNNTDKQLKNKCFELHRDQFETWMDELAAASLSTEPGSNGTAGVVVSTTDPSKQYLFDENGIEHIQLLEKGLMGAVFYYQATSYYLSEEQMGHAVNNTTPVDPDNGKYYTQMEHHWDEAFGYFGVPVNFPASIDDRFWGKYCNGRNPLLNTNQRMMNAFLTGRAAISNNDMSTKDAQVINVRNAWQDVCAGTAIHYLNAAKANLADDAIRNHALSEAYAFIWSLMYNEGGDFSQSEVNVALDYLGDNYYTISVSNINAAIDHISAIAGLDHVKNEL